MTVPPLSTVTSELRLLVSMAYPCSVFMPTVSLLMPTSMEIFPSGCKISYLSSEFHHFDSCIMSLKKLEEYAFELGSDFFTNDLGCAAYLLMHKFRLLGKKHRYFYFEISSEEEETQFREIMIQYSGSEFHSFDSKLMSLKKII
jgi:hypothetical protein